MDMVKVTEIYRYMREEYERNEKRYLVFYIGISRDIVDALANNSGLKGFPPIASQVDTNIYIYIHMYILFFSVDFSFFF